MADHHVRVILEAVDKGSANLRKFFAGSEREVEKFRKSLRGLKQEQEDIILFGGSRGKRGPGGRFEKELSNIEKATKALRKFKGELRELTSGARAGASGFASGLGEERAIRKEFEERRRQSKQAAAEKRHEAKVDLDEKLRDIRTEHDAIRRASKLDAEHKIETEHNIRAKALADEANFIEDKIRLQRELRRKDKSLFDPKEFEQLRKESDALRASERLVRKERENAIDVIHKEIRALEDKAKAEARAAHHERVRTIGGGDDAALFQQIRDEHRLLGDGIDDNDRRLRKFGLAAGRAFGQFRSGIAIGRNGLSDLEKQTLKTASAAQRLGARLGAASSAISPFRARTIALIAVLQVLGTLVTQLGAALVAVASSAILAAAALGGALLAGVTQLLPVVGLLAAAFSRLGKVLDAVKLSDKLELTGGDDQKSKVDTIRAAVQRLADSRYTLKRAGEAVKDAEYDLAQAHLAVRDAVKDQKEAVIDLANARKEAARDIIDANFEEREAALALQEAELGILDAKRRLREEQQKALLGRENIEDAQAAVREAQARLVQARAEGDTAEVATALQQLNAAETSLSELKADASNAQNDLKKAQIDVKQAKLSHDEAVVRNKRAQEDAQVSRKKGVDGSDKVISAQKQLVDSTRSVAQANRQVVQAERSLRDSIHAVAIAKREEKDAEIGLTEARGKATAQQKQLQNALGDLSPAEKRLFKSIQRIKDIYKKNFRPITDIIVDSFSRAVDTIAPLLQDPKILGGARKLATAIAGSVDKLARFSVSPEFKKFLNESLKNAAINVPKLTDAFISLFQVLIRVAHAATPVFNNLVDRFLGFMDRLEEKTKNPAGLEKFFRTAERHLDSWIDFAGAVGRILGLVIKLSAPAGKGILDDLTDKLNEWSDWLDSHGEEVREFFRNVRVQVGALGGTLATVAKILFKAFSSESASQLSIFLLQTVIPAFALFLSMLGIIAKILNTIFSVPVVGPVAKDIVKFALALYLLAKFLKTVAIPLIAFKNAILALKESLILLRVQLLFIAAAQKVVAVFTLIKNAIIAIGIASKAALWTPPIGLLAIIAAIVVGIVLLDRKFHFLMPTLRLLLRFFQFVFNWIKDHWKLLLVILLGPFGLVVLGIIKWRDKIIAIFKAIVEFIKDHWKLLLLILLGPFAITGAVIIGIIKFREKIFDIIKAIPGKIVGFFKSLPENLKKIFDKIPGLLRDALKGLGGIVVSAIEKIPGGKRLLGALGFGGKSDEEKFQDLLKDPILDEEDRKKAKRLKSRGLSNSEIIGKLAKDQGITVEQAQKLFGKYVFAAGGAVPGGTGAAVPIIAHAGEWVLNKMQQSKVAKNLGMSVEQLRMNLFGTGGASTQGTKPTAKAKPYTVPGKFNLVPKEDPDGIVVWFIEMADGAFGQVSARDARRIINTGGEFIPGYVRRSSHGFNARFKDASGGFERARGKVSKQTRDRFAGRKFAMGGVVPNFAGHGLQSFAEGGTVLAQAGGVGASPTVNSNFEQNFTVHTQGETDWNYVLRLGALHANSSYT